MANNVKFIEFCNLLEDIRNNADQEYKRKTLQRFYSALRTKNETGDDEPSLYPVVRLLLPSLERNRSYGMKEDGLRRSIIKMVCLSKDSADSKALKNSADFANTAYNVLRKYYSKSKNLTVEEINKSLDAISNKTDINLQNEEMNKLFKNTSPNEQKWIIRIILKQLGLGLGHKKILNLFHPDAENLFDKTNDLKHVCATLHDRNARITEIDIKLFAPFCPMLSKMCNAKELYKTATEDKMVYIENKFDGERFQLHMKDGNFMYYSRRGYNFTTKFGQSYTTGIYTPLLKNVFDKSVKSIILDGEMMGYDTVQKKFGSKGMNFDVKNLTDSTRHQPCLCVFDIVYLNDQVLTQKPLDYRKKILKSLLKPIEGVIMVSDVKEVYGKQEIIRELNESARNKEEGIVFKDPNSYYVTNSRNDGWWKMKLEYFAGVMSDLDVIVMGGFYGKGQKIDKVIVGVAVPSKRGIRPTAFHSLATLSIGLTNAEWNQLNESLKLHWKPTKDSNHEAFGLFFGKKKPDVWIAPENSCILEVRSSELTKASRTNPEYRANYTLRFQRIQMLRFDKPYYDCLTTSELDALTEGNQPVEKLFKRPLEWEDIEFELQKTKKRRGKFTVNNVTVENAVSNILKGLEFCIWTGNEAVKVADVEKMIKENGGNITKIESDKTYCILVGNTHARLQHYQGNVDIVKLDWMLNVIEAKEFYQYEPLDMLYTTENTRYKFMESFDKFGDSYTEESSLDELKIVLRKINTYVHQYCPTPGEINSLHKELDLDMNFQLFAHFTAYFDKHEIINDTSSPIIYDAKMDMLEFKYWGGEISDTIDEEVNLIIVGSSDDHRLEIVGKTFDGRIKKSDFICNSVAEYLETRE